MSDNKNKFFDIKINTRETGTDDEFKSIVTINADITIHQEAIQDMFMMEDNQYTVMSKLKDALYDAVLKIQDIE
jgi:hypothetical protein